MRTTTLALITLMACDQTFGGELRRGDQTDFSARVDTHAGPVVPVPAEMPAPPPLLPHGIDPAEKWDDPDAQCEKHAKQLTPGYKRRGVIAYCKYRHRMARRTRRPTGWVDGGYLHVMDLGQARKMWDLAAKKINNWIDPKKCPNHSRNNALKMATRGKYFDVGMSLSGHWLTSDRPIPCWDPKIFDWNNTGARVTVAHATWCCLKYRKRKCNKDTIKRCYRSGRTLR